MTSIGVTKYGVTHYYAQCDGCDWDAGIFSDGLDTPAQVRSAVRRHVRATGHSVVIESAKSTEYRSLTTVAGDGRDRFYSK